MLLAFQVGFDLIENEMQSFLLKVEALLDTMAPPAPTPVPPPVPDTAADTMDADAAPAEAPPAASEPSTAEQQAAAQYHERYGRLKRILSGEVPITLTMDFLFSNNHADLQVRCAWSRRRVAPTRAGAQDDQVLHRRPEQRVPQRHHLCQRDDALRHQRRHVFEGKPRLAGARHQLGKV